MYRSIVLQYTKLQPLPTITEDPMLLHIEPPTHNLQKVVGNPHKDLQHDLDL